MGGIDETDATNPRILDAFGMVLEIPRYSEGSDYPAGGSDLETVDLFPFQ